MQLYVYRNPRGRMNLPQPLPPSLAAFSPSSLAALGWHPAVITRPSLGPDQAHGNPALTLSGGQITVVYPLRDLEPEEIAALNAEAAAALEARFRLLAAAVDRHLDATVATRDYINITSACSYADDPDPDFAADGAACRLWRSAVWTYCRTMRDAVRAGEIALPTEEQLLAALPVLVWPA